MDDRAHALEEIAAIARRHGLSMHEIASALGPTPGASPAPPTRGVLVRVLGVLGATFVFAGIGVFVALQWDEMNAAARIAVTLGSGLAVFMLAVLSWRDARFGNATAPLLLVAAALEPTGMLVAFDELGSGGDWRWASLATAGTMAAQFGVVFAVLRRSTPLFLLLVFSVSFWWTTMDLLGADGELVAMVLGTSMMLAAIGIDRTLHRGITPIWYLSGAAAFLGGLFDATRQTVFEIGFLAAAAGFVYLSVVVHSRTLLFVATLAILAYTGWFTGQHFADSLGWPLALIAFGIFMIGLSAVAVRIDRQYLHKAG